MGLPFLAGTGGRVMNQRIVRFLACDFDHEYDRWRSLGSAVLNTYSQASYAFYCIECGSTYAKRYMPEVHLWVYVPRFCSDHATYCEGGGFVIEPEDDISFL